MLLVHQKSVIRPCVTTFPAPTIAKIILFTYKKLNVMNTWAMHEYNRANQHTEMPLSSKGR